MCSCAMWSETAIVLLCDVECYIDVSICCYVMWDFTVVQVFSDIQYGVIQ